MFAMIMYFIIYLAFHESGLMHSWACICNQVNAADAAGKIDIPADADSEVADVDLKRTQQFEVRTSLVWMM